MTQRKSWLDEAVELRVEPEECTAMWMGRPFLYHTKAVQVGKLVHISHTDSAGDIDDLWYVVTHCEKIPNFKLFVIAVKETDTRDITMELHALGRPTRSLGQRYPEYADKTENQLTPP